MLRILPLVSEVTSSQNVNSSNNVTGGVDYDTGPYTVIFPAGQTIVPFDVSITDDNICEGDEIFTLTINSTALPSNVGVGNPGASTVTIVDDEGKYMLVQTVIVSINVFHYFLLQFAL